MSVPNGTPGTRLTALGIHCGFISSDRGKRPHWEPLYPSLSFDQVDTIVSCVLNSYAASRARYRIFMRAKVFHVITKLELGGAQKVVLMTLERLPRERYDLGLVTGPEGLL